MHYLNIHHEQILNLKVKQIIYKRSFHLMEPRMIHEYLYLKIFIPA